MQSIATRFYRSTYLTLGLACICLGYAELEFIPAISAFAVVVLGLLVVAYRLEGRWSLSLRWANFLGGVIGLIAIVWVASEFPRADADAVEAVASWTRMLPYLGPLLMILIPAKLFRPKHNGDYWGLHGIGLIAVALGCALTGDPVFGVLLLAYLVSAVWSLTLFYFFRQEASDVAVARERNRAGGPRVLALAGRWAAAVTAVALALFLCTPRVSEARWDFAATASGRLQTGVDENRPVIDLNRNGTLAVNRDKVFEVRAFTQDGPNAPPKLDVDPGQRWRQSTFNYYTAGRWDTRELGSFRRSFGGRGITITTDPQKLNTFSDLGPGQFFLHFHLVHMGAAPRRVRAEPLAAPVDAKGETRTLFINRDNGGNRFSWIGQRNGEPSPQAFASHNDYAQVVLPNSEPGVSHAVQIENYALEHLRNCESVPKLRGFSRALLAALVEQGRLPKAVLTDRRAPDDLPTWVNGIVQRVGKYVSPFVPHVEAVNAVPARSFTGVVGTGLLGPIPWAADTPKLDRDPDDWQVAPIHYEKVCRAFENYLAHSGQFSYSTILTRHDPDLDPIEDFVLFTRKGHCNRFATALALMLRSVGVPTQVVLGYRGYETAGDGLYEVLQCHAHGWVEAVIYREPTRPDEPPWHWLTLDPTPAADDDSAGDSAWGRWWETTRQGVNGFFKNFIVEYDAERQERTRYAVSQGTWKNYLQSTSRVILGPDGTDWVRAGAFVAGVAAAIWLARSAVRRWRRSARRPADPAAAFYGRLLGVLARTLRLAPGVAETPGEFAAAVAAHLRACPATAAVADVPTEATVLYYRARFGARPLAADELRAVNARLGRLELALNS